MKKLLSGILCIVMMLSISVPAFASEYDTSKCDSSISSAALPRYQAAKSSSSTPAFQKTAHFTDVPASHWAHDAIAESAEAGIAYGFGVGTFRPDSPVNYAQFSALLGRVFYSSELDFSDYDSWYEPYTIVLSAHNIFPGQIQNPDILDSEKSGKPLGVFDMAQFLYHVLIDHGVVSPSDPPFISSFDDLRLLDGIPSEYHSAIKTTYSLGLLDGIFDLLSAHDVQVSRAQACTAINRLSDYLKPDNGSFMRSGLMIGGQLTIKEATHSSAKVLLSNTGRDMFSYSPILALKHYENGTWAEIPYHTPDHTVSEVAILHQLTPGQETAFSFNLSYYYGSVSAGYYKLETILTQNGKDYFLSSIIYIGD